MKELSVSIEINGTQTHAGTILTGSMLLLR